MQVRGDISGQAMTDRDTTDHSKPKPGDDRIVGAWPDYVSEG